MVSGSRRGPGRRLALTLAALTSLIAGYYLGQIWQGQPPAGLSAVVYPDGKKVDFPPGLALAADDGDNAPWRLFLAADTGDAACRAWRRNFSLVINRMAHRPALQERLRLSVLAYDRPDPQDVREFAWEDPRVEVFNAATSELDTLGGQLGLLPSADDWCVATQANAILVAPDATAWALLPYESADIMARNILTIIDFVE